MIQLESRIIIALNDWFAYQYPAHYPLYMRHEVGGKRNAREANFLKREGQKAGTPDLQLAIPIPPYNGLFLEVKTEKGKLTENQRTQLLHLAGQGYAIAVGYGLDQCQNIITTYLGGEHKQDAKHPVL